MASGCIGSAAGCRTGKLTCPLYMRAHLLARATRLMHVHRRQLARGVVPAAVPNTAAAITPDTSTAGGKACLLVRNISFDQRCQSYACMVAALGMSWADMGSCTPNMSLMTVLAVIIRTLHTHTSADDMQAARSCAGAVPAAAPAGYCRCRRLHGNSTVRRLPVPEPGATLTHGLCIAWSLPVPNNDVVDSRPIFILHRDAQCAGLLLSERHIRELCARNQRSAGM
jgi:hypothetical protein